MLEALYQRYYKELYIFVFSLCASESVTDDILQDTFLKALLTLKDSHTNMRAWLYMVARNLYYNYYNRQKKTGTDSFLQMEGIQRQGKRKQKLMLRNKEREVSEGRTRKEEVPRKRISIQNLSQ